MEWFEFRQAEFNLWSRTISAATEGKSSLDYRLQHHPEWRKLVCNLLDGLMEAFDDLLQLGMNTL
ncbi:hypothetical protein CKAH01_10767 [Colletotrichum kahawae]|uniref:Uncharacterized protein n=1 Tax=Colletotrichum kahawae TaxID=34407 RepID=A0AAD9XWE5_COLKA|nr:hypothetical protein CKAH01_10767 [Colletotrichum kahawae]